MKCIAFSQSYKKAITVLEHWQKRTIHSDKDKKHKFGLQMWIKLVYENKIDVQKSQNLVNTKCEKIPV